MTLRWKTALLVLAVFSFAIGMVAFLDYSRFRSQFGETVRSRILFVGGTVRDAAQQALSLGLGIDEMSALQDLIEAERNSDQLLMSIDVADAEGKVIYSTDPSRKGMLAVTGTDSRRDDGAWEALDAEAVTLGLPIRNDFELRAGSVVLRYSRPYLDANATAFLKRVGLGAGAILAGALVLVTAALWYLLARLKHMLAETERPLAALLAGHPASELASGMTAQYCASAEQADAEIAAIELGMVGRTVPHET